ncbi:MAG: hypothetical protein AAGD14_16745, partial [Planctomycetota bacterium]
REEVAANWSVTVRDGRVGSRRPLWESAMFRPLMAELGHEIVPGFFSSESGVRLILDYAWDRVSRSELEMAVTANDSASIARWIVLQVELEKPTALEIVRTKPVSPGVIFAHEATVKTAVQPAGTSLVAVPLDAFDRPDADVREVEIAESRSRLVRLRLRAENGESLKIKTSLWSARPPASASEDER